jgi:hypothetical protein
MYNDNLVSLDIDTFNNYCPGVYEAVQNCKPVTNECCLSTCASICGSPSSNCDKNWKDICDNECPDIVDLINRKPVPEPTPSGEDSFDAYCECIKKFLPGGGDINKFGNQIVDCCTQKSNRQDDCTLYVAEARDCGEPNPIPSPQPIPTPVQPPAPKIKPTQYSSVLDNLTTTEKVFLYGGVSIVVILLIILIYMMLKK